MLVAGAAPLQTEVGEVVTCEGATRRSEEASLRGCVGASCEEVGMSEKGCDRG